MMQARKQVCRRQVMYVLDAWPASPQVHVQVMVGGARERASSAADDAATGLTSNTVPTPPPYLRPSLNHRLSRRHLVADTLLATMMEG